MSIAKKIITLYFCSGLLLCCMVTGYVAHREYEVALDKLVDSFLARAIDRPQLQLYFYRPNELGLNHALGDYLSLSAVRAAVAYNSLGEVLARKGASNAAAHRIPSLNKLRQSLSVTEAAFVTAGPDHRQARTGFLRSLVASVPTVYWTMPIFSEINPVGNELGLTEFADALIEHGDNNSLIVIGYLQLAIDRGALFREIRPLVSRTFFTSMVLMTLFAIPIYYMARRSLRPLTELSQLACEILAGSSLDATNAGTNDEFQAIGRVLQGAKKSLTSNQYQSGLENKLLSLKAEERATQLSMREQELSKATEEISATKDQLYRLANYDRLTSLPNRQMFTEQLQLLLRVCARNAKPLALLFINLKDFYRINESLGRSMGDLLLQEVGKRLVGCLRSSDVLAYYVNSNDGLNVSRIGADEFAVVLGQLDSIDSAGIVAQRVIDRLVQPMDIQGHELVVGPCIGIAVAPRNSMEPEELLRLASNAMHHAKVSSSEFLFYNDGMQATDQDDLKMESELRKAMGRNQLHLHYQPQVDISTGSVMCAEALLRWEHPDFGQVSPARFIVMAETMGLIGELGDWVLVEACRQMKAFQQAGLQLPRMAVNISPQQFKPAFVTRLQEVLTTANLPPSMLELGLSEEILMDNDNNLLKFLNELKEVGVYLSLENFGTKHAPISYLSRYPFDEIKIDRSFVLDCDKRKEAARLVQAIIAMARSLALRTVAEGVETAGEYQFLAKHGVRIMRGYLFSKPVPADELQKMLLVPWHFITQIQHMTLAAELDSSSRP